MQSLFKKSAILSVLLASIWTGQAQATSITWTFNNATLKNTQTFNFLGTTITNTYDYAVTGSFSYDADTKKSSNANISFTYSDPFGAKNQPFTSSAVVISYDTLHNQTELYFTEGPAFRFDGLLSNAGGTKSFINYNPYANYSIVSTGTLTASSSNVSAVPVPAAAWLFGSGLAGLAGLRRRKQAV